MHSTARNKLPFISSSIEVDASGITRRGARIRHLATADISRIHVFADEDGRDGLVVRGPLFRLFHFSRNDLAAPGVLAGVQALVQAATPTAEVDEYVHTFLAGIRLRSAA
jgi:hypothetical protein